MQLLESLRQHLLDSPLGIKSEDLRTFADKGTLESYQGEDNQGFAVHYDATIIVVGYSKNPAILFFLVQGWLKQHQANHKSNPVRFDADIISHKEVDIELVIPLEELIAVTPAEGGVNLTHHGVEPVDIGTLDAGTWELYIDPEPDPVATWVANGG